MAEHDVAREWGQEFARVLEHIGEPSLTPREEELREALESDDLRIFGEIPNVPREWAHAVFYRVSRVLDRAPVTGSYKKHLADLVLENLEFGPMRLLGSDVILHQCGIDPTADRWDIFDPGQSQQIEKEMIRMNIPFRGLLASDDKVTEHHQNMDRWIQDYKRTYNEDPLV